jgi:peroxiredoxin
MLSDFNREFGGPYGVAIDEVAGHRGVHGRAAFVVGPDRRLLYAWYAPDLGTLPDPAAALAALEAAPA